MRNRWGTDTQPPHCPHQGITCECILQQPLAIDVERRCVCGTEVRPPTTRQRCRKLVTVKPMMPTLENRSHSESTLVVKKRCTNDIRSSHQTLDPLSALRPHRMPTCMSGSHTLIVGTISCYRPKVSPTCHCGRLIPDRSGTADHYPFRSIGNAWVRQWEVGPDGSSFFSFVFLFSWSWGCPARIHGFCKSLHRWGCQFDRNR